MPPREELTAWEVKIHCSHPKSPWPVWSKKFFLTKAFPPFFHIYLDLVILLLGIIKLLNWFWFPILKIFLRPSSFHRKNSMRHIWFYLKERLMSFRYPDYYKFRQLFISPGGSSSTVPKSVVMSFSNKGGGLSGIIKKRECEKKVSSYAPQGLREKFSHNFSGDTYHRYATFGWLAGSGKNRKGGSSVKKEIN